MQFINYYTIQNSKNKLLQVFASIIASMVHFCNGAMYGYSGITIVQLIRNEENFDVAHIQNLNNTQYTGSNEVINNNNDITLSPEEISLFSKYLLTL